MRVSTSNIAMRIIVGVFTSSPNLTRCLCEETRLFFIQSSDYNVLFSRPVSGEWVAAFIVVMEVIQQRFGACMHFFNEGIVHVTRLGELLEKNSHISYSKWDSLGGYHTSNPYFFAARFSSLVRIEQLCSRMNTDR